MTYTALRVPKDRADQLRSLAKEQNKSISGLLGDMIQALYGHHKVAHSIPSIDIFSFGDGVTVKFPNSETCGFTNEHALEMSKLFREYVTGGYAGKHTVKKFEHPEVGATISIQRRGSGYVLRVPVDGPEKTFNPDTLSDLANILERHATQSA